MRRFPTVWILALLATPAVAQQPAVAASFARSFLEMVAPQRDAPDDNAKACLQAIDGCRSLGYAHALARLVRNDIEELQRPAELLPTIEQLLQHDDLHGALRNSLRWLRYRILRAAGRAADAAAVDPAAVYPRQYLAIGPFGQGEDHFGGVPYAPELQQWTLETMFVTPTRLLHPRAVEVGVGRSLTDPRDPAYGDSGCYYVLHRVVAAQETQCYLDLWSRGAVEVFVNGAHVALSAPDVGDGRNDRLVPIAFGAGTNHVLLKTCTADQPSLEVRYVDARQDDVPGLRELAATTPIGPHVAPVAATLPPHRSGVDTLQNLLAQVEGDDRDALRITAGLIAETVNLREAPLALIDGLEPTQPLHQLALARLWRRLALVPEEMRNSRARALEEAAGRELDATHFAMLRADVGLLQEQDKREQALQKLWQAVDEGRAGHATFTLLLAAAREANFPQERARILRRWREALPNDPLPCIEQSKDFRRDGAARRAAEAGERAIRLRPDIGGNLGAAYQPLVDLGELDTARELVALVMPPELADNDSRVTPLLWEAAIARRGEDQDAWRQAVEAIVEHPDADADDLRRAGDALLTRGFVDAARYAYDSVLERQTDDIHTILTNRRAAGLPEPGADFTRFWRDGDAAMQAFTPGEREDSAPATTLIHQRIVEVFDDGAVLTQEHELRRLNDPSGVEQFSDPSALAEADQVLMLRTIDTTGEQFVPVRLRDGYSMPRLEPGAFVEWRHQTFSAASDDGVAYVPEFLFRSAAEHMQVCEFVLIKSKDRELDLRSRNLSIEPERIDLGDDREALRYVVEDSRRLLPENSMPPLAQLVPVLAAGDDSDAEYALRNHARVIANISRPTPPIRKQVATLLEGVDEPRAQLQALYDWCQREIAPARARSATETLLRKRGDRSTLLLAMLDAAGFTLEPARCESIRADLITGDGALFRHADYFYDMGCVRVRRQGMTPLWLFHDAPRYYPVGEVPPQRAGGGAIVMTEDGVEVTRLPISDLRSQTIRVAATGTLTPEQIEVDAVVTLDADNGYRAAEHFLQQPRQAQMQFARGFAQQMFQGWQLLSAEVETLQAGEPVSVRARLRRRALQSDGERELLAMPLPPGGFLGAFGARPDREVPMRHTTDLDLRNDMRLKLQGVHVTELPETLTVEYGPLIYLQQVRLDGDELVIRRRARMGPATLSVAQFGDWTRTLQLVEGAENLNLNCRVD